MKRVLKVAPALSDEDFLLGIRRLAGTIEQGGGVSPFGGCGDEFRSSRHFQPGDCARRLDWRALARLDKLLVREFETPKRVPVYIVVDRSASMSLGSGEVTKYALATSLAGALAYAALKKAHPVALLGSDADKLSSPTNSAARIASVIKDLRDFNWRETTTLVRCLSFLTTARLRTSLVIILSDLCDPQLECHLASIAKKHDCIVFHCFDPTQEVLAVRGCYRVREAERLESGVVFGSKLLVDREVAMGLCRKAGAEYLFLSTGARSEPPVRDFLRKRSRRCHGGAI